MSKIFEALNRENSGNPDVVIAALQEAAQETSQVAAPEPLPPAPKPAVMRESMEQPAAPGLTGFHPRTLSLRLHAGSPLLPFENNWRVSEQYRIIRTKLVQHPKQPQMLVVSSATPGDGKSVTAVNLAGVLALKTGANVLLVDGDFRRSSIHTQLGVPLSPGVSDVLVGACSLESALIHTEQLEHLYVLTAGSERGNPVELLDSSQWRVLCADLRKKFRYIVIDCPPVGAVADYDLIQASCDGVILVIRPDHTNRKGCMRALELIPKDKMIGVVLNCVEDWFLTKAYRYDGYYDYQK